MADWSGIRSAIAAQCAAISGIREGTSTKLSGATLFPCVKVEQVLEISIDNSRGGRGAGYEARIARIGGKLLVAKAADVGRAQVTAETYVEELFVAARGTATNGMLLGYATIVEDAWLQRAAMGQVTFGGEAYYGADLEWMARLMETATRTA